MCILFIFCASFKLIDFAFLITCDKNLSISHSNCGTFPMSFWNLLGSEFRPKGWIFPEEERIRENWFFGLSFLYNNDHLKKAPC